MKVYFGEYEFKPDEVDELPKEYRRLVSVKTTMLLSSNDEDLRLSIVR